MAAALQPQDHLYTLVTRDARATNVRVIGSIVDYVLASPSIDPLVARLAQPETRIVSLTITEGGYPVDEATGAFLPPPTDALPPAFEALARALRARRDAGLGGFTVLCCDNIMGNGDTARTATLGVCAMVEPGLEEWVGQNVAFPNGMVDRITPQTADADREFLATEYGLIDRWPVVAETFIQWVIEDDFPYGRPPYEDAGVLLTDDVRPYETLKLRILNAGHSTTTYMAALVGHVYIHEIMADPLLATYMQRFHDDEATPSLPAGARHRRRGLQARGRGALRQPRGPRPGGARLPRRHLQVPQVPRPDHRVAARQGRTGAAVRAGAGRLVPVPAGQGRPGARHRALGRPAAGAGRARSPQASQSDPAAFLGFGEVFGQRLASDPVFRPAFVAALTSVREVGVHRTLERWLSEAT